MILNERMKVRKHVLRRCKHPLNDLKEMREYGKLKEELKWK
jgi:hypothetical protein